MEDMTVVSEMGEQWSPKIPPDSTTPMAMPTGGTDGDGQRHGDGDEDGEYAPGAAGGEGGQAGSDEDDSAHRGGVREASRRC